MASDLGLKTSSGCGSSVLCQFVIHFPCTLSMCLLQYLPISCPPTAFPAHSLLVSSFHFIPPSVVEDLVVFLDSSSSSSAPLHSPYSTSAVSITLFSPPTFLPRQISEPFWLAGWVWQGGVWFWRTTRGISQRRGCFLWGVWWCGQLGSWGGNWPARLCREKRRGRVGEVVENLTVQPPIFTQIKL